MSVTLVGAALFVVALYFCAVRPARLVPMLVFFASFSGTSVLNFSSFGVSIGVMMLGVFLTWAVLSRHFTRKIMMGRSHPALLLCLLTFALFALSMLILTGARSGLGQLQVTQMIYLLAGIFMTAILSYEMSRRETLEACIRALRGGAVFIAAWGIVQAACFYAGLAYPAFLFNNSSSTSADMFDQRAGAAVIRIASVTTEPSFLASSLMIFGAFGATLVVCEARFRTRAWVAPVVLVLLMVAVSTSTTGFIGLAVLGLLLARRRPGMVLLGAVILVLIGAIVLALSPAFQKAIIGVTIGKVGSTSYADRTATFETALHSFTERPWFGNGWASDFSYSMVTNMLANVGVVGFLLFLLALGGTILTSWSTRHVVTDPDQWRLRAYAMGAENAMIVYMMQAVVAGLKYVVPDLWCLWALTLAIPSNLLAEAAVTRQAKATPSPASPQDLHEIALSRQRELLIN